jgi:1,4-alpha-glucan branching enzyme
MAKIPHAQTRRSRARPAPTEGPGPAAQLAGLLASDSYLRPYADRLKNLFSRIAAREKILRRERTALTLAHDFFGLHKKGNEWIFREWAPHAAAVYLIGDRTNWKPHSAWALAPTADGVWEIRLPAESLAHGDLYRLFLEWPGGSGDRIPAYARRIVQDPVSRIFNAQVWTPSAYVWRYAAPPPPAPLLIYEAHIGMAQEEGRIGTYREFAERILPRIVRSGYNALQLMGIQEHPYYASFGYHVSSFFAASSRFGTPEELKELIDAAHGARLFVIMDLIHSHAVGNDVEGLSRFDGTSDLYFHAGRRGFHEAWGSRCFDYGKAGVLRFLLSNCRFWLSEYHIDGFRFDGITSMLYRDHGLGKTFTSYDDYFNANVDEDALVYLALANRVVHSVRPRALTLAEDVSGMPALALPAAKGGIGFDCRLAMGIADFWIRLMSDFRDEDWPMERLWYELTNRRSDEKTVSYAESHDQALVGDKTLIFRMADAAMYGHMSLCDPDPITGRAVALHKMIRLITLATAGHGYQNFMGNEFGHPEWIDFPREGNGWSYAYARRQWHLADDPDLKYALLGRFDRDMIALARRSNFLADPRPRLLHERDDHKVLVFQRGRLIFSFNFHPTASYPDYAVATPPGAWRMILDSDDAAYGGHARLFAGQVHCTLPVLAGQTVRHELRLYLPTRTALVLELQS